MRRSSQSAFGNPVLVGAVTVLAVMVALFLAYDANQGLPFVPTRELKVDIADGSNLVAGNDVSAGGARIGLVSSMKPVVLGNGQVGAQLVLKLNKSDGNVPVDSQATILPRSVLGLKYVQLTKGSSSHLFPDGGTLPITQTTVPVQFDDIYKTFDPKTRTAIQQTLAGAGDTLAGRGSSLNDTIHSLPNLLGHLEPVARYLSAPSTGVTRFFRALNNFLSGVAPVAQANARVFGEVATTLEAFARDPKALQQTIALSPPTLAVGTDALRAQQPFLVDFTTLGRALTPATAELRNALPNINPALEAGTRTLIRTPSLDAGLQGVMDALKQLAQAPGTNMGINALSSTVNTLNPILRYIGPFQTVCNDWNYWWTYIAEAFSHVGSTGYQQFGGVSVAIGGVGNNGGTEPANAVGGASANLPPLGPGGGEQFLHAQAYGAAIDNHGNADCETGQRGYVHQLNHADPLGRMFATDPHTPGNQGPTFTGRARVPAGETFSRNPSVGPQIPYNPANP